MMLLNFHCPPQYFMQVYKVYRSVALGILLIGLLLLLVRAPWQRVYPADPGKVVSMPRAAVCAHSNVPGARVNTRELLLEGAVVVALAAMVARIGEGTRTRL